jgi:alkaline phosphatase D
MNRLFGIIVLLFLCGCQPKTSQNLSEPQARGLARPLQTIAFGSCNRQDLPQDIWQDVLHTQPDLWIWLGDNIYGDTEDIDVMLQKYNLQKSNELYQKLRATTPIIGIWDDHDYGVSDGDKSYPKKQESKALMLDFLDVPANAPVRTREGAYQRYTFGTAGQQVKIILLDTRYFRDELQKGEGDQSRRYLPNPVGDMLGEAQWQWLEAELTNSTAQIHLIGSGVQIIPEEHPYEKWANFPAARQRLFELLVKTQPAGAILLSGDRHIAEISKLNLPGLPYPLYDITSSGMTHAYTGAAGEANRHRIGDLVNDKNFGVLSIDWNAPIPKVSVTIRGWNDHVFMIQDITK